MRKWTMFTTGVACGVLLVSMAVEIQSGSAGEACASLFGAIIMLAVGFATSLTLEDRK